jgi:predicted nucleic acid-binding protein
MKYLLDVNALLALGVLDHELHQRVATWVDRLARRGIPELATCSITELGFVRVLGQAQQYRFSTIEARELLLRMKTSEGIRCTFILDGHDISHLPRWVRSPKQTTDGHLLELAKANKALLATLDGRIPGAFVIPQSRQAS